MKTITVIISNGAQNRMNRIRKLRNKNLADEEIVLAAIAAYWLMLEREKKAGQI